jgi:hypothetical protein
MAFETIIRADPLAAAGGKVIATPFQFLTTGEDHLRIRSFNSLAGVVLSIDLRTLDAAGDLQVNSFSHTPNTDRSANVTTIALTKGYVLNLVVRAAAGSPVVGQTYVIVELVRGLNTNAKLLGQLLGAYVTSQQGVAFPGSPIESSIAGGGNYRYFSGTVPAPGAEVSEAVPTGARWEPIAIRFDFLAGPDVGNRYVQGLLKTSAVSFIGILRPSTATTVGLLVVHIWQRGFVSSAAGGSPISLGSLPDQLIMPAGSTIKSATVGLFGADQFVGVELGVREWLEAS